MTKTMLFGGLIPFVAFCIPRSCADAAAPTVTPGLVMERCTIARDDKHHLGWPMVCIAANGDLVCSYSVADVHGGGEVPQAVVRISQDQGHTWSDPIVIKTLHAAKGEGFFMCRWVSRLQDNSLLLAADWCMWRREPTGTQYKPATLHDWWNGPEQYQSKQELDTYRQTWLFRSADNGRSWTGPEKSGCITITLTMTQISDGTLFLTGSFFRVRTQSWLHVLYRSKDNGKTWSEPLTVFDDPKYDPNEGCVVEMPGGTLVMYERTDKPTKGAIKMISDDGGATWKGPFAAGHCWVDGRVFAHRLSTGEVLVVHRIGEGNFGFFVETPKTALARVPYDAATYKPTAMNWGFIDVEHSSHPDGGYGGWVELPDGNVYAVTYITDDAPKPQIRGYRLSRETLLKKINP